MRQKKWDQPLRFSREAAREYSPGREPGVRSGTEFSPEGAAEKLRHRLRVGRKTPGPEGTRPIFPARRTHICSPILQTVIAIAYSASLSRLPPATAAHPTAVPRGPAPDRGRREDHIYLPASGAPPR